VSRHFGTIRASADMCYGQFGTGAAVPVWTVRQVCGLYGPLLYRQWIQIRVDVPVTHWLRIRADNFWTTVCKTVCPMLSVRCPVLSVCLSVTFVHCGQTIERIKTKLGTQVGLSPGHIVLDGDPAPPPPKGHSPPIFGPHLLRPNGCMDQDVTWN